MLLPALRACLLFGALGLLLDLSACKSAAPTTKPLTAAAPVDSTQVGANIGHPVGANAEFRALFAPDAQLEVIATGFSWTEGPLWVPRENALLFSHAPTNQVLRWTPATPAAEFLKPSGYAGADAYSREPGSNGLTLDAAGRLVLCQHGNRRVAVRFPDGHEEALAAAYQGKRLNSPNDLVFRRATGDLYFTDPPYGLPQQDTDPSRELPFSGVYRRAPDGTVTLLTQELAKPNGVALAPDEQTLYVSNSDPARPVVMAYAVQPSGELGPGRVFYDFAALAKRLPGLPDGLKVDQQGHVFVCGPGGVSVLSPKGELLGQVATGRHVVSNCAWGDADGRTLFVTAAGQVARLRTLTQGANWPKP